MLRFTDSFRLSLLGVVIAPTLLVGAAGCSQGAEHAPPPAMAATPEAATDDALSLGEMGDPADACVGTAVPTEELPVDVFAVIDSSGSMDEATATGVSKWYATKAAFQTFLGQAPRGMRFGLSLFPVPGDDTPSCRSEHYRDSALAMADVSEMASGALTRLDGVKPRGQTPTAPALTAALDMATTYAVEHPERSVVVVLATDGLPTTCAPTEMTALAALAKEALNGAGHVRTLVVASRSDDNVDMSGFERLAAAGGTRHPVVIDPRADFAKQLSKSLSATAARQVACDLALPEPPSGKQLDYDTVNVVLDGDERVTLPRVANASACKASGGWYYDVDPAQGAPTRLNVCQAACERTQAAKLTVELGCQTAAVH